MASTGSLKNDMETRVATVRRRRLLGIAIFALHSYFLIMISWDTPVSSSPYIEKSMRRFDKTFAVVQEYVGGRVFRQDSELMPHFTGAAQYNKYNSSQLQNGSIYYSQYQLQTLINTVESEFSQRESLWALIWRWFYAEEGTVGDGYNNHYRLEAFRRASEYHDTSRQPLRIHLLKRLAAKYLMWGDDGSSSYKDQVNDVHVKGGSKTKENRLGSSNNQKSREEETCQLSFMDLYLSYALSVVTAEVRQRHTQPFTEMVESCLFTPGIEWTNPYDDRVLCSQIDRSVGVNIHERNRADLVVAGIGSPQPSTASMVTLLDPDTPAAIEISRVTSLLQNVEEAIYHLAPSSEVAAEYFSACEDDGSCCEGGYECIEGDEEITALAIDIFEDLKHIPRPEIKKSPNSGFVNNSDNKLPKRNNDESIFSLSYSVFQPTQSYIIVATKLAYTPFSPLGYLRNGPFHLNELQGEANTSLTNNLLYYYKSPIALTPRPSSETVNGYPDNVTAIGKKYTSLLRDALNASPTPLEIAQRSVERLILPVNNSSYLSVELLEKRKREEFTTTSEVPENIQHLITLTEYLMNIHSNVSDTLDKVMMKNSIACSESSNLHYSTTSAACSATQKPDVLVLDAFISDGTEEKRRPVKQGSMSSLISGILLERAEISDQVLKHVHCFTMYKAALDWVSQDQNLKKESNIKDPRTVVSQNKDFEKTVMGAIKAKIKKNSTQHSNGVNSKLSPQQYNQYRNDVLKERAKLEKLTERVIFMMTTAEVNKREKLSSMPPVDIHLSGEVLRAKDQPANVFSTSTCDGNYYGALMEEFDLLFGRWDDCDREVKDEEEKGAETLSCDSDPAFDYSTAQSTVRKDLLSKFLSGTYSILTSRIGGAWMCMLGTGSKGCRVIDEGLRGVKELADLYFSRIIKKHLLINSKTRILPKFTMPGSLQESVETSIQSPQLPLKEGSRNFLRGYFNIGEYDNNSENNKETEDDLLLGTQGPLEIASYETQGINTVQYKHPFGSSEESNNPEIQYRTHNVPRPLRLAVTNVGRDDSGITDDTDESANQEGMKVLQKKMRRRYKEENRGKQIRIAMRNSDAFGALHRELAMSGSLKSVKRWGHDVEELKGGYDVTVWGGSGGLEAFCLNKSIPTSPQFYSELLPGFLPKPRPEVVEAAKLLVNEVLQLSRQLEGVFPEGQIEEKKHIDKSMAPALRMFLMTFRNGILGLQKQHTFTNHPLYSEASLGTFLSAVRGAIANSNRVTWEAGFGPEEIPLTLQQQDRVTLSALKLLMKHLRLLAAPSSPNSAQPSDNSFSNLEEGNNEQKDDTFKENGSGDILSILLGQKVEMTTEMTILAQLARNSTSSLPQSKTVTSPKPLIQVIPFNQYRRGGDATWMTMIKKERALLSTVVGESNDKEYEVTSNDIPFYQRYLMSIDPTALARTPPLVIAPRCHCGDTVVTMCRGATGTETLTGGDCVGGAQKVTFVCLSGGRSTENSQAVITFSPQWGDIEIRIV